MCNERQHAAENVKLRHDVARLKESARYHEDLHSSYAGLVHEIRKAAGDPEGKLMQDELIKHIENLANRKQSAGYDAWRITFQSPEHAAKAAFDMMMEARRKTEHLESMIDHGIA